MNGITGEQKLLGILAHISYFFGGLGFITAPLVIFLLKKDDSFVYEHAKQALVAHLAILAMSFIVGTFCMVIIGVLLLPVMGILWVILFVTSILGALKALNGETYEYPLIQGLIKKL